MIAELDIQTQVKLGKTILKKGYFSPPFKLANVTEDKLGKALLLMLMSSSPGILSGDNYQIKINIGEDSILHLQTQSYSRIFTMVGKAAQNMEVHVNKNASFYYLPHPVVPHENADFVASNKIYLSDNCTLVWGEILTCGRKLNGEIFKFRRLQNITSIYLNNKLIIKENLLIKPQEINLNAIGQLEGFTHQASLFVIQPNNNSDKIKSITNKLESQKDIVFGMTTQAHNAILVRVLGNRAEQLHSLLKSLVAGV